MYRIPVYITTLTPIVLSERSGESVLTETAEYFSGSTVRGMFARHCGQHIPADISAEQDDNFFNFILSGNLRFSPAYLKCGKEPAYPVSFSFLKNKEGSETMDILKDDPKPGFKPVKGFATFAFDDSDRKYILKSASVKRTISFHMSRQSENERIIGSSKDGQIYNYEAISAGQEFVSYIYGEKQAVEEFYKFLCETGMGTEGKEACIGRSKRTQYGKCKVSICQPEQFPGINVCSGNSNAAIALRFTSDFIPCNNDFDSAENALEDLKEAIRAKIGVEAKIAKISAVCGEKETFVRVWGIKRPRQRHFEAGSAVLIAKENGSAWTEEEIQAIAQIGCAGVGQRTGEGFGSFDLWPLNMGLPEKPEDTKGNSEKADLSSVKDIVKKILVRRIEEHLQIQAWKDIEKRIKDTSKKHIFARLENILSKAKDDDSIFTSIRSGVREKSITEQNLRQLALNNVSLMDILSSKEDWEKYANAWKKDVFTPEIQKIIDGAGIVLPDISSPEIYRKYWLNYFRFARKAIGKGGKK